MSLISLNNNLSVVANTIEEEIVWEQAAKLDITKIERLYKLSWNLLEIYDPVIMYIGLDIFATPDAADSLNLYSIGFYDHANNLAANFTNIQAYVTIGTVFYIYSYLHLKNVLFSRMEVSTIYPQKMFNGYILTVNL